MQGEKFKPKSLNNLIFHIKFDYRYSRPSHDLIIHFPLITMKFECQIEGIMKQI